MVVNEGAGEVVEFEGRRLYTLCVGEKGVFRFKLSTEGRAGHASMPAMGDNALLRMVDVLGRLDGRQPASDRYPAGVACLEALAGVAGRGRRRGPGPRAAGGAAARGPARPHDARDASPPP